jgi:hypothetical protein
LGWLIWIANASDLLRGKGPLRVNLEPTCPTTTIAQSLTEISKVGGENILASHPRERLLRIIMEVNSATELTNHQRMNRLRESDKVKDIHLEQSLIDEAKVLGDIVLKVLGVEIFGHHIEPTLHVLRHIIEIIPHGSLRISPELLVTARVPPLMKAIRVLHPKAMPSIHMS